MKRFGSKAQVRASGTSPATALVHVQRPNHDRGRGAGFIPQEREHRTDVPAKSKTSFAHQHSCGLKSALRCLRGDSARHVPAPSSTQLS